MTNTLRIVTAIGFAVGLCPIGIAAQQSERVPVTKGPRSRSIERASVPAPQGFSVVLVLGEMQGSGPAENVPPAARKALADMKDFLPYKSYRLLDAQWTLCCGRSMIATRLRGPDQQDYDLELDPGPSETSGKWNVRFLLREATAASEPPAGGVSVDRSAAIAAQRAELETRIKQLRERYDENHPQVRLLREQLLELDRQQLATRKEEGMQRRHRTLLDTSFTMDIGETVVVGTSRLQGDKALIALLTAAASTKPSAR